MRKISVAFLGIVIVVLFTACKGPIKPADVENWKIGTATGIMDDFSLDSFLKLKSAGIDYIEMGPGVFFGKSYDERVAFVEDILEKLETSGVRLWSVHFPFGNSYDISHSDEALRAAMISECIEIMALWEPLKPSKLIIHPSAEPISTDERAQRIENSIASLRMLTDEMNKYEGSSLALENLPRTCLGNTAAELLMIVESVGNGLEVCLDTNHMLEETPEDFMAVVGDKITTVHFSDYGYVDGKLNERHWLPGEGMINWSNVIRQLKAIGFEGPVVYETWLGKPDSVTSVRRKLSAEELVESWIKIKNDHQLTLIN
jgi:sugar phosphate isomerase/epimerase